MDSKEIKISPEIVMEALTTLAVESWRFGRVFGSLITKLDAGEQRRYESQFLWFNKKIEDSLKQAGLNMVNIEGQPFDPGMAVTPLNIEEFETDDKLYIDQMLEPIIMNDSIIIKAGTVTLRRVKS